MQYGHRKLQRSVTEMRRSRRCRPSRSVGCIREAYRPIVTKPCGQPPARCNRRPMTEPVPPGGPSRYLQCTTPDGTAPRPSNSSGTGTSRAPLSRGQPSMSNNEKRGFRLPWGGERGPDDGAVAATLEPRGTTDDTGDETPAGPFRLATTAPEAAMIDSEASTTELAGAPPAVEAAPSG